MIKRSRRILLWSLAGIIGVGFLLLVVFGEIFQCQRMPAHRPTAAHLTPPKLGDVVQLKPGVTALLKASVGEIELPPGSLVEVTGVQGDLATVRLISDGSEGELEWNDGFSSHFEPAPIGLVELYAKDTWTALEALELTEPLGLGWSPDAYAYAAVSGDLPLGGRNREWVVVYYSEGLKRVLRVVLTVGAQPAVQEDSPPAAPTDDHTHWPLGSARLDLGSPAVDSPAALEAALAADDRGEEEKSRWEFYRIYLVHQDDPDNLGDPWRNTVTYRIFQRLAVRMNPDDEAAYTDFVVDAQTGEVIARLP